jgi:hypothetical protein
VTALRRCTSSSTNTNGHRLLPGAEPLYYSAICSFHLNELVINKGALPLERIDQNLRVDVNWLRRLTGSDEEAVQVTRYAKDLSRKYPGLEVRRHVVYTIGAQPHRFFTLD